MSSHDEKIAFCYEILDGLSVGDAYGEALSYQHYKARESSDMSRFPSGSLVYTDDTEMALGIVEILSKLKGIDEDTLAWKFAERFRQDPDRGYGRMARKILRDIGEGADWRHASSTAFGGGSFGNGAAMRVAPVGAYYFSEPEKMLSMATASARVTHYHPEGIAGAVAIAAATAAGVNGRGSPNNDVAHRIWDSVQFSVEPGATAKGIAVAREFSPDASVFDVVKAVGNGAEISSQDTVPFCIWNACRCLNDYREALISTVEVGGDCDTNCAIVGAIVTAYLGSSGIPADWLQARESLNIKR